MTVSNLWGEWAAHLKDAVLPAECPGCGGAAEWRQSWCPPCRYRLRHSTAILVRDLPNRVPACLAAGAYRGPLRASLLAYKERGRRDLAAGLAGLLAARLAALEWPPVCLVPIPATTRARRRRGYDHVPLLCHRIAAQLPGVAVASPLRVDPRPDSAGLNAAGRLAAARASIRPARRVPRLPRLPGGVLLVDDIVTTGATLSSAARALESIGVACQGAITLAATPRRKPPCRGGNSSPVGRDIPTGTR